MGQARCRVPTWCRRTVEGGTNLRAQCICLFLLLRRERERHTGEAPDGHHGQGWAWIAGLSAVPLLFQVLLLRYQAKIET